ncbi:MAG TPA: alginate lyase family protein [Methylomirabilota bacterium]|nr:alginate lyase family protein [Methylomirabilota bacterium]
MPATLSKYLAGDPTRSVADPAATSKRRRQLADLRAFVAVLDDVSSRWEASRGSDLAAARCVHVHLAEWAAADGLMNLSTEDAFLTRDVLVVDVARAWARVRIADVAEVDPAIIETWFGRIARDAIAFYEFSAGPRSRANNHRYWAGAAVGTIGALTQDPQLMRWAADTLRMGLCQVRPDGALPLELERGRRALEYHVYALRALATLDAALADGAPPDLGGCADGLRRLHAFTAGWLQGSAPTGSAAQEPLPNASRRFMATYRSD